MTTVKYVQTDHAFGHCDVHRNFKSTSDIGWNVDAYPNGYGTPLNPNPGPASVLIDRWLDTSIAGARELAVILNAAADYLESIGARDE